MTLRDDNRGSRTWPANGQSPVVVTDHAVLRYLERAHGLNINQLRDHIAGLCNNGARLGARAVIVENVKFMLARERVVTVLERFAFRLTHIRHCGYSWRIPMAGLS